MTGAEFIRAMRKLGRRRGVEVRFVLHDRLALAEVKRAVPAFAAPSDALLADMLRQLGLEPRDLDR
jgi:hypothetical protein